MDNEGPPLTQQGSRSQVKYGSIFLFEEDINVPEPFSIFPLSFFRNTEFQWDSITGEMNNETRAVVRTFPNLTGRYRIFGKIEHGEFPTQLTTIRHAQNYVIIS